MSLPAPNLDDRRFQDLVDDAKRMVQSRCPEWTDHNVSDPGITLIETFAYMTDQILYRLNRVPDRLYVKFLELIGVKLLPPTPARAPVTFWLSTPATETITIPTGTRSGTVRTEIQEPVVFASIEDVAIVPCALEDLVTQAAGSEDRDHRFDGLSVGTTFSAFQATPQPGDTLSFALSDPVPSCVVQLMVRCHVEGVGVDPTNPPLVWEAQDGNGEWRECVIDRDDTGGLNKTGEIVLYIPRDHAAFVIDDQRAGWIRARVTETEEGQPTYSASPIIEAATAATIGGTADSAHADVMENEGIGISDGIPGQSFTVARPPILSGGGPAIVEVGSDDGWIEWTEVDNFAHSGPNDHHFVLDAFNGEVIFGPLVRDPEGGFRQFGAVPPKGVPVRMRCYTTGGGRRGNVPKGAIRMLKSAIPFVAAVSNRDAAQGGVDGEDIESAKTRGPIVLHTRSRAVTAEDFEQLTRQAAPEIARVRCLSAGEGADAGAVRVLVVPAAAHDATNAIRFEDLIPAEETLQRVAEQLDDRRLVGTRLSVEPPLYRGVTVVATLRARAKASAARVRTEAVEALNRYLNPLIGGPDGDGWPWGRPLQAGEVFSVLQGIRGVELVEDARIFGANPVTGERGQQAARLELEPNSLVFSFEHQIRVEEG
jgi:predicted phage baseplate assembly protein